MTSLETLLTFSDKKLERHLDLIQAQIKLAITQKNNKALERLQKWEAEVIAARFIKLSR